MTRKLNELINQLGVLIVEYCNKQTSPHLKDHDALLASNDYLGNLEKAIDESVKKYNGREPLMRYMFAHIQMLRPILLNETLDTAQYKEVVVNKLFDFFGVLDELLKLDDNKNDKIVKFQNIQFVLKGCHQRGLLFTGLTFSGQLIESLLFKEFHLAKDNLKQRLTSLFDAHAQELEENNRIPRENERLISEIQELLKQIESLQTKNAALTDENTNLKETLSEQSTALTNLQAMVDKPEKDPASDQQLNQSTPMPTPSLGVYTRNSIFNTGLASVLRHPNMQTRIQQAINPQQIAAIPNPEPSSEYRYGKWLSNMD